MKKGLGDPGDFDALTKIVLAARARDPSAGHLRLALHGRALFDGSPASVDVPADPGEAPEVLGARLVAAWADLLTRCKPAYAFMPWPEEAPDP